MKKITHLLFYIVSLIFVSSSPLHSSSLNPEIVSSNFGGGAYQFGIDQLPTDVTSVFWILGDGYFRTGLNINHNMKVGNGLVQAYMLKPYRPTPPTKIICGSNCPGPATSQASNFQVSMGPSQSVKVGASWNPVRGQKHYTILTFENVTNHMDGSIRLEFQNNVHSLVVYPYENNSNWFNNLSVNNSNKVIEFDFVNLQPGEQRHLLVETQLLMNTSGILIPKIRTTS